jgi:hypothetical protein
MVTGAGFGESRPPQNLESSQRRRTIPPSWGSAGCNRRARQSIIQVEGSPRPSEDDNDQSTWCAVKNTALESASKNC